MSVCFSTLTYHEMFFHCVLYSVNTAMLGVIVVPSLHMWVFCETCGLSTVYRRKHARMCAGPGECRELMGIQHAALTMFAKVASR